MMNRLLALPAPTDAEAVRRCAASLDAELMSVSSLDALFRSLAEGPWDCCLVSLSREAVDEAVLERLVTSRGASALILSARGVSLDAAVLAERLGAVALLREPLDPAQLRARLESLADEGPTLALREAPGGQGEVRLVGDSPEMGDVFQMIAKVAPSMSTVLVTGESGTGKEVVARTLHDRSKRADGPFVAVNCAAIPEHLLESELFGHERGAFTGAVARRGGRFQRAHGGTLFLDEVGDMSPVLQAKVLRALEERQVERVGGQSPEAVDVRLIAATNRRLSEAIEEGRFREDLYYRLAVVEIELPPLRERGDDLQVLALHFGALFAERHGRPIRWITRAALDRIAEARWEGNVRELRNVLDRAVLLTAGDTIRSGALRLGSAAPRASSGGSATATRGGYPPTASLAEVEADHIGRVLDAVDGHIGKAADVLGIHRNTLSRKIQEYSLDRSNGGEAS